MNDDRDKLRRRIENELRLSKGEAAKNALALLFPAVDRAIDTYVPSDSNVSLHKENRRISQKDFSGPYFSLNPDPANWGRSEFTRLITEGPEAAFSALESRTKAAPMAQQTRLRRLFLELLDATFSTTVALTQPWLDRIVAESPKLIRQKDPSAKFLFTFDNEDRLRWLITNALEKLPTLKRAALLKETIRHAADLSVLAHVIRDIVGDKTPDGVTDRSSGADLGVDAEAVRMQLLSRIKSLVPKAKIWTQAHPARLLWFWWGCDLATEVRAFTKRAMKTKAGLLGLLEATIGTVTSSSEGTLEHVNRHSWSKIVDIDVLILKANQIARSSSNDRERDIATRFLNAVARDRAFESSRPFR